MHGWTKTGLAVLLALFVGLGVNSPAFAEGDPDNGSGGDDVTCIELSSTRATPGDEGDPDDYDLIPEIKPPADLGAREELYLYIWLVESLLDLTTSS